MLIAGFKIWYADGTTFSSSAGTWDSAPADGVLHVMVYYDRKDAQGRPLRLSIGNCDWYFYDGAELIGGNRDTLESNESRYPGCAFKQGKWTTAEHMERVQDEAMADYAG